MKKRLNTRGIGLIEVLIAASIITIGILALIEGYTIYVNYALANTGNVQAAYLMEEGLEVMTFIRDKGWTANIANLSTTTTYYIAFNTSLNTWTTTITPQYVDVAFLRSFQIQDVNRDFNARITSSGGTYDPETKLIQETIQYYQGHGTTTRTLSTYITNLNND
jgi:Tfp pilus assembly protein PilV